MHDVEQRSPEWHALRAGRVCGSRAADMLAMKYPEPLKSGAPSKAKPTELAGRRNLRAQLVLERITGRSQERGGFTSQAMQDGADREAAALEAYEALSGRLIRSVGFVSHLSLMAGYSPDGVVGEFVGLVEAKSPLPATHLDYLESGKVPGDYYKQVLHGLWLTGAAWCDWLSFHPEFPEALQVKLVRIHRDEAAIAEYDQKIRAFLAEVDQKVAAVRTMVDLAGTMRQAVAV